MKSYEKNDRYQAIRRCVDRHIIDGYKLWKTNYMGYDLMTGGDRFAEMYTPEDLEAFKAYTEHKIGKLEKRMTAAERSSPKSKGSVSSGSAYQPPNQ